MSRNSPLNQASDVEELARQIEKAHQHTQVIIKKYQGREQEIDALEDEIIKNHINPPDTFLKSLPDHVQIQGVLANAQKHLSRVAEIYAESLKNYSYLSAVKNVLYNSLLPVMQGGSADVRNSKAENCTDYINFLIEIEKGLINVCETSMKNMKSVQESASRQLKGFEFDLVHFNGAETFKARVIKSKQDMKSNQES